MAPQNLQQVIDAATERFSGATEEIRRTAGAIRSELEVTREELSSEDGFVGVNGLFRFDGQGTTQRRLSVYQISGSEGAVEISPAAQSFDPGVS